jgi:hypothetical protein
VATDNLGRGRFGSPKDILISNEIELLLPVIFGSADASHIMMPWYPITKSENRADRFISQNIQIYVAVIGPLSFRKARIVTLVFEPGARSQRLESEYLAKKSLGMIQSPGGLKHCHVPVSRVQILKV